MTAGWGTYGGGGNDNSSWSAHELCIQTPVAPVIQASRSARLIRTLARVPGPDGWTRWDFSWPVLIAAAMVGAEKPLYFAAPGPLK